MDAFLILKQIELNKKKLEKMDESTRSSNVGTWGLAMPVIISAYAAYLSYECNSKLNVPEFQKIIFAILAAIFGFFYLIYYFLFRYDTCISR